MINAVATAIYNKLKADSNLMIKLGGTVGNGYKCYFIKARQDISVPYLTFGLLSKLNRGTFAESSAIQDSTWWVNVFSGISTADVAEITDSVIGVLDDASLIVTGYINMKCIREFISGAIYDMETNIFQISIRYRIWID